MYIIKPWEPDLHVWEGPVVSGLIYDGTKTEAVDAEAGICCDTLLHTLVHYRGADKSGGVDDNQVWHLQQQPVSISPSIL